MEPLASHSAQAPEPEYRAVREGAAVLDRSMRELVRLTGSERVSFLHGMVTNDIEGLPEGGVLYAALLTPKGQMVSDARVLRRPDDLLVEVEPGMGGAVRAFLDRYLISEDVELHDATAELAILSLLGPRSPEALAALGVKVTPDPGRFQERVHDGAPLWVLPGWLPGVPGVDLLVPRERWGAVYERLLSAAVRIGFDTFEVVRVEAGVPRYGQDMDETTIPLEAGLERAISYQKGCYIGQEVIARATFRGQVSRKLCGLLFGELEPPPRTELRAGERKAGWVTSVVRSPKLGQVAGLGYVHRSFMEPGTKLELVGFEGGATVAHSALAG